MKAALQQQPLSVAIQADKPVFQMYHSGIFSNVKCGTQLDHAVMVVGWGEENGQEYWIMRNSWGTTWGELGYMRVAIQEGSKGVCGIQSDVVYPTGTN
jgi:C1A family cysteine protease